MNKARGLLGMKRVVTIAILLAMTVLVMAASHTYQLAAPKIIERGDYSYIELNQGQLIGEPGTPALPYIGSKLLLPLGMEATDIRIERKNPTSYTLSKPIAPMQAQYPFSQSDLPPMTLPNQDIYGSDNQYPSIIHNGFRTEFLAGHSIAFSAVCPFTYNPQANELVFYSTIQISFDYAAGEKAAAAQNLLKQDRFTYERLSQSIDNDSELSYYTNRTTGYEYLIICDQAKFDQWQTLKDFYVLKGFSVLLKSVQEITATQAGADTQAKIRNFIIDFYATNDLRYVLLAGDTDVIPHRGMYVNMGQGGQTDADIPADMYYSCLDGTWNNDNDNYWGEMYENDLAPEVALGRICYNSDAEISAQINKILGYQFTPVESEVKKAFFAGEWLWDGPTWGGTYMDEMIGGSSMNGYTTVGVPTAWDITTLYDRTYGSADSWSANQIRPILSQGPNLVNHLGHSNTTYTMRLSNNQVSSSTITNDGATHNFSIYFTQGCYSGAFDNRDTEVGQYVGDCVTEKMTSITNAAAGMIAHSRYGWGMQGSTNGASQYLHRQYIDAIFGEGIHELGYTLVDSKIDNIPFVTNQAVMYWVVYETNLFGDPAMMIWTDTPQQVVAQIPNYWAVGVNSYQIGTNAPNAELRIIREGTTIFEGLADAGGTVNINLLDSLQPGQYDIHIFAPNFYNYQSSVVVTASQMPYVVCSVTGTDSPNQLHLTGHTYNLNLKIKNVGLMNQNQNGTVSMTSNSPNIEVLSQPISFNALSAGDSTMVLSGFQIRVNGSFPDLTLAGLTFTSNFDGYSSQSNAQLRLNAPNVVVTGYQVLNNGGLIMPGHTPSVTISLSNTGSGTAQSPMMLLMTGDPYIQISATDVFFPELAPGQSMDWANAFTISVSPTAEIGHTASIDYVMLTENDAEETGVVSFNVGLVSYGFEPDFQNWTSSALSNNFTNQWHRSSYRNSTQGGSYSAKFGGQGSASYANSTHGGLVSPVMQLGVNSRLKFNHWIDAENHTTPGYAWDGGLVQISVNDGPWTQITPLGGYTHRIYNNAASPFAANTYCYSGAYDWREAEFDLAEYSGTAKFRFVFGSDAYEVGEGWYIDDVRIESDNVANDEDLAGLIPVKLLGNYPNPFNPSTTISFSSPALANAKLGIYNLRGQLVKQYQLENLDAGIHSVVWNGTDQNNRSVSSGVYYYRLQAGNYDASARMIMIK